jgi:PAS domain S-box-containing protein
VRDVDHLALLSEHSPDLLSVHDVDGAYLYASPAHTGLLGYLPGELLGLSVYDLVHPHDRDTVVDAHLTLLGEARPVTSTTRLRGADGRWHWVETTGRATPRTAADAARIVAVSRPLDARGEPQQRLMEQRELTAYAAELEDLRAGLLTAVFHELRTPLTTALGMAETLRRYGEDLPPDRRAAMTERLAVGVARLRDRVLEAVSAGQLLTRSLRVERRPVRIHDVVAEQAARTLAADRPLTVAIDPGETVIVDPGHLGQIVSVLLGNADKHTPPGEPVFVRLLREDDGITLVIEDRGPGVPEQLRERIFEPFTRWRAPEERPGLGLGLYLVAGLAHLYGGRAWVEDRPGGGSSFRVHLPTSGSLAMQVGDAQTIPEAGTHPDTTPVRVLLVDDDRAVLDTASLALELEGIEVAVANNGSEALAALAGPLPDVVVLDVMMPDMDGWEVAAQIAAVAPGTAIVFCSALVGEGAVQRGQQLGAVAHLSKPFDPDALVTHVLRAAGRVGDAPHLPNGRV